MKPYIMFLIYEHFSKYPCILISEKGRDNFMKYYENIN